MDPAAFIYSAGVRGGMRLMLVLAPEGEPAAAGWTTDFEADSEEAPPPPPRALSNYDRAAGDPEVEVASRNRWAASPEQLEIDALRRQVLQAEVLRVRQTCDAQFLPLRRAAAKVVFTVGIAVLALYVIGFIMYMVRVSRNSMHICPPELKVRTPAHTKHSGWYLEFESRVTHSGAPLRSMLTPPRIAGPRPLHILGPVDSVRLLCTLLAAHENRDTPGRRLHRTGHDQRAEGHEGLRVRAPGREVHAAPFAAAVASRATREGRLDH